LVITTEIHLLNKNQLEAFIYSKEYDSLEHIPITRHRAIFQVNNPRAGDEDILLILALEESRLAGYLGVIPDYLYNQDQSHKVGWLSCNWGNSDYRGKALLNNCWTRHSAHGLINCRQLILPPSPETL